MLDNCEHVIDACARLAEDLLRAGPGVRVLATSREPLHCEGEVAWRVPSLAEASRLFVERAAADPRLQPDDRGRGDDRRDLPAAGRHAAGHRAGRGARGGAVARPDRRAAGRQPRRPRRRQPHGAHAPADAARHDRLEPRPAHGRGARALPAARRVRRRLHPGGGRGRLRRRRDRPPPDRRPPRAAGRQVARQRRPARRFRLLDTIRQYAAERLDAAARARHRGRAPPRLVPGAGRGARPAVGRPAPLAAHAGDRARQPARGADLRPAPRPAGRAAPGHVAVALLAGPRLLRRGRPLAGGDAGRRARAHRAARGGAAGQRRALPAQRQLRRRTCTAPRRRSPTTASWATSTRPPRPSTSTRCSSSRSATPPGPTRSSPTRSPSPAASATAACWRPPPTPRP